MTYDESMTSLLLLLLIRLDPPTPSMSMIW